MTNYEIRVLPREGTTTSIGRCVVCAGHVQDSIPGPENDTDSADFWQTNIGLAQLGPIHEKFLVYHPEQPDQVVKCHLKCAAKLNEIYWAAETANGETLADWILKFKAIPRAGVTLLAQATLIPENICTIIYHWNQHWKIVRKEAARVRALILEKSAAERGTFD